MYEYTGNYVQKCYIIGIQPHDSLAAHGLRVNIEIEIKKKRKKFK
jgi:hypothetical protein